MTSVTSRPSSVSRSYPVCSTKASLTRSNRSAGSRTYTGSATRPATSSAPRSLGSTPAATRPGQVTPSVSGCSTGENVIGRTRPSAVRTSVVNSPASGFESRSRASRPVTWTSTCDRSGDASVASSAVTGRPRISAE